MPLDFQISLPPWEMGRILKEAVLAHNLLQPQNVVELESCPWPALYGIVLAHLRHAHCDYDAVLSAAGGDSGLREEMRKKISLAAYRQYRWLRSDLDPRTISNAQLGIQEPNAKRPFSLLSRQLSDLVTRRAPLWMALEDLKKHYHADYKERLSLLKTELQQVEQEIGNKTQIFRVRDGMTQTGISILLLRRDDPQEREYLFGGQALPENYTKSIRYRCPRCHATVMRSKRPLDHGAGIRLLAFSCHCLSVSIDRDYSPKEIAWQQWVSE